MIGTPWTELQSRLDILQKELKKEGVSGVIIFQNVDLYYYTGETGPDCFFVPEEGDPILFSRRRGELPPLPWPVKRIKRWDEMPGLLEECGISHIDRIGFEGDVLPAALYLKMKSIFKNAAFLDVSFLIRTQRAVKSDWELHLLRETARKALQVWEKIPDMIRESETDFELSARVEAGFRGQGHMGFFRCRGFNLDIATSVTITGKESAASTLVELPLSGLGINRYFPVGSSGSVIETGSTLVIDCGSCYFGYIIDQTRTFAVGQPHKELEKAYNVCLGVQDLFEKNARPGITCGELYHMATAMVSKTGFAEGFMGASGGVPFIGHGVGLEVDEFPIICRGSNEMIREGMVIAVEPKFALSGIGAVGIENCYEVTAKGVEKLTLCSDRLGIV